MSKIRAKFCGLKTAADVDVAAQVGAAYAGFVFFEKSPRNVTIEQARDLAIHAPIGLAKVALVVNPTDDALDAILRDTPIDIVQLHGSETPERVAQVRQRTGLPVMKAIGISNVDDVHHAKTYSQVADQLLLDAKAQKDAALPGGNGHAFDWSLIRDVDWGVPWMLAGGLTPDNAASAVAASGSRQLDVSSGIESSAGVKDHARMQAFMDAVN